MDRTTKSAIKKLVLNLRHLLENDIEVVLKRYGLFTDRPWLPPGKIPKADTDVLAARRRMEAAIAVEQARGLEPGEATRWYVREVAFTYLNRLAGLKCLEVRGLIDEVITTRVEYGGRSLFHRDFRHAHPDLAAQPDDGLPAALEAACRRVTDEMIGVLFDPDSESSIVWPRYQTLREAIGLINDLPAEVWAEDEIIGWVYQFYNAEEKERIRKRGKPKLPAEVAVINQFFTPRWVVKFLVDNTLGRLWLEMRPDSERVRAKCDYSVPEPLSVDDDKGTEGQRDKETRGWGDKGIALDPDSPVNNSEAPPRRDPKPVTEIRLIDPACGTMHFGYYAFEVLQEMYLDSLEHGWPVSNPQSPISNHEIPNLILRHNLYGVDIDLRAVQLAALSLYMKACTAELAASPQSKIEDRKSKIVNLVCADARLTDGEVRARFLDAYKDDPALQKVWRELFSEMEDVAQVGSLLRVEERFRQLLQAYSPASVVPELDADRQLTLDGVPQQPRQMGLAEVPGATAWSPRRTLAEMLEHLRHFARDALEEADVNAQLFAAEAEKTLGLLDVLLQDYDVVVMNPPFGYTSDQAGKYIASQYPRSKNNLLCTFVERTRLDLCQSGYVGAILDRTFLIKSSYKQFRREILLNQSRLKTMADLGWGVLDEAQVETVAIVLASKTSKGQGVFLKLDDGSPDSLQFALSDVQGALRVNSKVFIVSQEDFVSFPNSAFAYWTPYSIRQAFLHRPSLASNTADAKEGIHANDADAFLRYHWEVNTTTIGQGKKWAPFANGGGYSPYYRDIDQVILYENDAWAIRNYRNKRGEIASGMRNPEYQFISGITYGKRTDYLNVQRLYPGSTFSQEGRGIFPRNRNDTWPLIAILNSQAIRLTINLICGQHKTSGYVALLPYARPSKKVARQLGDLARVSHDLKFAWDTGNEICTRFTQPCLLQLTPPQGNAFAGSLGRVLELLGEAAPQTPTPARPLTITALLDRARAIETTADTQLQQLQAQIDEAVYDLYEISSADRALIERELGDRPPELVWPQMEGKSDKEKRREHVRCLLSYFILQAIKADQDGILSLVEHTGESTALARLRERLEAAFGADVAFRLEDDAGRLLGKSVDKWLDKPFIQWHTKLYKRRPIIWHIASPRGTFGALVYYHKLDRDTLPKVRNVYLRTLRDRFGGQLEQARSAEDYKAVDRLEAALDDLAVLDERLGRIIEAGYDPVIDDGVKANILPLQEAGVLRQKKVV
ncbi:MAG: BREX-1 system adenine-specific DNA-methyltransferase PglX [Chloroflexota bacterium]|nr:BREX-1 system adenine-specific DNA-methyltransferase PglX [Chloroflexota bacterium]